MTDPRRLAWAVIESKLDVLRNALGGPYREELAALIGRATDETVDDETPDDICADLADVEADLILAALDYLMELKAAAGGPNATLQDLELLLDARAVADVILTVRDNLAREIEAATEEAAPE